MSTSSRLLVLVLASTSVGMLLSACAGSGPGVAAPAAGNAESVYGPLDIGADWQSYTKVSAKPFLSKTHGGRFVEVYVNDVAKAGYVSGGELPAGSILVKTSWQAEAGQPTTTPGPIFVMRKEPAGTVSEHNDWTYALHWEAPVGKQAQILGGPVYWRGRSSKVDYCWKCHENFDREIGGVPADLLVR